MKYYVYFIVLLISLLSSCKNQSRDNKSEEIKKANTERNENAFKVGVTPTLDCLPIFLLKDSILYDTAKVDIKLKLFTSQMDCDTAMLRYRVQACVTDLIRCERLKHKFNLPLIYLTETNANWQLVVNKESKIKKLSDLSDKIIAMSRFSITDYLTDKVIDKAKPKYSVYKSQINNVFIRLDMLLNNEMDAIWCTEPQTSKAIKNGGKIIYDSKTDDFHPGALVFIDNITNYQKLIAFKQAYNKAVDLINKHGIKYYGKIIVKYMNVDEDVVKRLPKLTFKTIVAPRRVDILKAQKINAIKSS